MLAYEHHAATHHPSPTSSRFTKDTLASSNSSQRSVNTTTASPSPAPSPTSTTGSHGTSPLNTKDALGPATDQGERGGEEVPPPPSRRGDHSGLDSASPATASALSPTTDGSTTPYAASLATPTPAAAPRPDEPAGNAAAADNDESGINPLFALGERARAGEVDPARIVVQKDGVVVREGAAFGHHHGKGRGKVEGSSPHAGEDGPRYRHFFHSHHHHGAPASGANAGGETLRLDEEGGGATSSFSGSSPPPRNGNGGFANDRDGDGRADAVHDFRDHPDEQDRLEQLRMKMRAKKEEMQDRLEEGGWITPDDDEEGRRLEELDPKVAAQLDRKELGPEAGSETDGGGGASSFYSASQGGDDADVSSYMGGGAGASTTTVDSVQTAAPSLPSLPPRSDSPLSYASLSEVPVPPPLPPQQQQQQTNSPGPSFQVNGANRSPGGSNPGFVVTSRRSPHPSPSLAVPTSSSSSSSATQLPPRTSSLAASSLVSPTPIRRTSGGVLPVRSSPSYTDLHQPPQPPQPHGPTSAPFLPASLPRTDSPLSIPNTPTPPPPSMRRSHTTGSPSPSRSPVGAAAAGPASSSSLAVPSSPLSHPRRLSSASSSGASARSRGATLSVPAALPLHQLPPQRSNSGSYPSTSASLPPLHSPPLLSPHTSYLPQQPFSPTLSAPHPNAHLLHDDVDASIAAQAEAIRRQRQEKRLEAEKEAAKAEKRREKERERSRERPSPVASDRAAPGAGAAGGPVAAASSTGLGVGLGANLKRRSTRMGSGSSQTDQAVKAAAAGARSVTPSAALEDEHPSGVAASHEGSVPPGAVGVSDEAAVLPTPGPATAAAVGAPAGAKRARAAGAEDDDGGLGGGVLVGNLIGQDHANYVLMYNMLTGIRIGVSRCQAKLKRPLTDADYTARHKFSFDIVGNELTPSVKYDFKFKDYAPWVFRELREYFYLDPSDYLISLTAKYILSELGSPGKSGSFFYFSRDYRFIIKTIRHAEHKFLRSILKDYHEYVKKNPHTLISRFYGLHRVKLPHGRKIHFVIMNNLFPPHRDIHETYDLKGSAIGRLYPEDKAAQNPHAVLKDLNWVMRHRQLALGPEKKALFEEQLRRDTELLQRLGIMDYSLLTGIHNGVKGNSEGLRENKLSVFQPDTVKVSRKPTQIKRDADASALRKAVQRSDPQALGGHELPEHDASERRLFLFYQDEGGMRATGENNEDLGVIYYLGIIDILTPYTLVKRLEHFVKGFSHDKHMISAVPPKEYGDRFLAFIRSCIRGNDESLRPRMFSDAKKSGSRCGGGDGGAETTPPPEERREQRLPLVQEEEEEGRGQPAAVKTKAQ
ncbi:hypothetical protein JCM6882_006384 [Rhodosporidiobolus microsporus]